MKKVLVKIEKDTNLISAPGLKHLYPLLENKDEVFKATIDEEQNDIRIDITKYAKDISLQFLKVGNKTYWSSYLNDTINRKPKYHTFCIIKDNQLEFDF